MAQVNLDKMRLGGLDASSAPEVRDSIAWLHGQGFPKGKAVLKPAFEPIFVGRKPQTRLSLTHRGRQAWNNWLDRIERLTRAAGTTRR